MSTYKGKTVTINVPAPVVAGKFDDLIAMQKSFDNIPAEMKEKMGDIRLEPQAIVVSNPMAGEMRFEIEERSDNRIVMGCSHPMRLVMDILLEPVAGNPDATEVSTAVEVDLPFFLKPLLGPRLQQAADGFSVLVANIANAECADKE